MTEEEHQLVSGSLYGSSATRAATGIDAKTLTNWIGRQPAVVLLTAEERREAGERKRYAFPFTRVMQIALTAETVELHVQPREAALAASRFTDVESQLPHEPSRKAGQLFKGAHTYLVVAPNVPPYVVPAGPTTTLRELLFRARPATKAIIIDVDDVYWRVADRLLPYALKQKAQVD